MFETLRRDMTATSKLLRWHRGARPRLAKILKEHEGELFKTWKPRA